MVVVVAVGQTQKLKQMIHHISSLADGIERNTSTKKKNKEEDKDDESPQPLHSKDMKPPTEFGGGKKEVLAWSFTSMLKGEDDKMDEGG